MKRKAFLVYSDNNTLKVNTPYLPQKYFNLEDIGDGHDVIDLVNLTIDDKDESLFSANVIDGDGSKSNPYEIEIVAVQGSKKLGDVISIGTISRGETKVFSVYLDDD